MTNTIEFRSAVGDDFEFLSELRKSALGPYIDNVWGWVDVDQRAHLRQALGVNVGALIRPTSPTAGGGDHPHRRDDDPAR